MVDATQLMDQLEADGFELKIATHDLVTTLFRWGCQENRAVSNRQGLAS